MSAAAPLGATQIKAIWSIGRSKLGLDEDAIRTILFRETGKVSMKECNAKDLDRVLLALRNLAEGKNYNGDRATKKQAWMIRQLEEKLGWNDNPQRLAAFLLKYYKVEQPEWLTRAQAWKAIESLKKVLSREE